MSGELAARLAGFGKPGAPARPDAVWIAESTGWLSLLATTATYAAQPGLWHLGEEGRARTTEDFAHHLRAALAGELQWREHLQYCLALFDARGFPQRWLSDAFVTLAGVLAEAFGETVAADVQARLAGGPALLAELAVLAGIDLDRPTRYDADLGATS